MVGQARNKVGGLTYLPQTNADQQTGINYPVYPNPTPDQLARRILFNFLSDLWVEFKVTLSQIDDVTGTPVTGASKFFERNANLFDFPGNGAWSFKGERFQIAKGTWDIDVVLDGIADYPVQLQLEGGVLNPQPEKELWPLYIYLVEMDADPRILNKRVTVYSDPNFSFPIPPAFQRTVSWVYIFGFNPRTKEYSRTKGYLVDDLIY